AGAAQQPPAAAGGKPPVSPAFPRVPPLPFPDAPQELETLGQKVRVVPLHKGLANPWSLTFLPNGDMLITEKPGRLRIVRKGELDPQPIGGVPTVWAVGQGGLLEVLPHPRFSENQFIYLTYSKPCAAEKSATTALARGKFDGKALTEVKDLFVADNCNTGNPHYGSKLAWGRDGLLYMTIGERGDRKRSQDPASHGGKLLRLREDGTAAPDNPFVGKDGFKPEIYTWGHRNAQGLAFHPTTGALWLNEHGPQGGDELNLIEAGKNYGWPVVSYGREYPPDGSKVSATSAREGFEEPVVLWVPSIGISGMIFYTGDKFPSWKGNVFVGGLSGLAVHRLGFNDKGGLLGREVLIGALRQRIRDVRQGPDGHLYLAVDANPGGILRVEPAGAATTSPANGQ
ncbi:MAG TPA: PQQ-dependent sugar dehydrogenase, partial [Vicinamibacterales bacterium]|nr:PQQ-dependent sugar dehydrogenase [Vicinamibacterales bacterium]